MGEVIDFNTISKEQKELYASSFVDVYLSDGRIAAGKWASETIPTHLLTELYNEIEEEFAKRGYDMKEKA